MVLDRFVTKGECVLGLLLDSDVVRHRECNLKDVVQVVLDELVSELTTKGLFAQQPEDAS